MRRTLLSVLLLAAASCGGSPKQSTTPPPLEGVGDGSDAKPEAKPEAKEDKPPAPPPEPPAGPIDVTIPAPKVTVKLVSPGKGKRVAIKVAPKTGDKQAVELALDFSGKQTAPPEAPEQVRGTKEDVAPTLVLTGNAEVKNVDASGTTQYQLAVDTTDVRDAPGQQIPSNLMKQVLAALNTLKIDGTIAANGIGSDLKLHLDKGDREAAGALELVRVEALPAWPVLPTEPIGVGAKWQVTATLKLADKLDVTQTTDYELLKHDGKTWTIKGTTKVSGTDQDVDQAKLTNVSGSGTADVTMIDGALFPSMKAQVATAFSAIVTAPPNAPPDMPKTLTITYELKQGSTVTPNPTAKPAASTPTVAPTPAPTPKPGH